MSPCRAVVVVVVVDVKRGGGKGACVQQTDEYCYVLHYICMHIILICRKICARHSPLSSCCCTVRILVAFRQECRVEPDGSPMAELSLMDCLRESVKEWGVFRWQQNELNRRYEQILFIYLCCVRRRADSQTSYSVRSVQHHRNTHNGFVCVWVCLSGIYIYISTHRISFTNILTHSTQQVWGKYRFECKHNRFTIVLYNALVYFINIAPAASVL